MYNVDKYFDFDNKQSVKKPDWKKQQKQILLIVLLVGLGYYFFIYLPEEENQKKKGKQQSSENKSEEELKTEQEENAWEKGRIWELPVNSWADRIVNGKKSSLLGEYQKFASWFPEGDKDERFYFSRAAPYKIFFPPSLRSYYDKGKELELENCEMLERNKDLILSDEIKAWIRRAEADPTRGNYEDGLGNNALFYGAPGTGKTETMRNLCVKADKYPLVVVAGSDLTPTDADQKGEILPLHKFAYTISELEWSLVKDYGFEREENGEVKYMLFVDEANQISNNSLVFQSNGLKFLKDCLESADKDRDSKNLWAFATNHRDQVEKATFRKGRLSNPLDFTWNWKVFKEFCKNNGVDLPKRWKDQNQLVPEDEKWLADFNIDVFNRYFLGKDGDVVERREFWNLFIEKNPDAEYIPKRKDNEQESNDKEDEKEVKIEIGEFLEFFWHIKEKYSTSFNGIYERVQKLTMEKVLDVRLSELIKNTEKQLDNLIDELETSRKDGKISEIMTKVDQIIKSLANR